MTSLKQCQANMKLSSSTSSVSKEHTAVLTSSLATSHYIYLVLIPVLSIGAFQFSRSFPHLLWSKAKLYYILSHWQFNQDETHFDNSPLTWGTDYFLAVVMLYGSYKCLTGSNNITVELRVTSSLLFFLYFVSVLFGGMAHQYYTLADLENSFSFKLIWFICVGSVTSAGGIMGLVGSKLNKALKEEFGDQHHQLDTYFDMIQVPTQFWIGWCFILTWKVWNGELSYHRPACDIFIAGTTQIIPTAYCISVVLSRKWYIAKDHNIQGVSKFVQLISLRHRVSFCLSLVLNCPLLPAYPLLLHLNLDEGIINAMLHFNLFCAWGLQCYTVYGFIRAFAIAREEVEKKSM